MARRSKRSKDSWQRSLAKAITYRILILTLDFTAVYLFTGQLAIAFWFMIISNVYTAVAYYGHERFWNRILWGRQ